MNNKETKIPVPARVVSPGRILGFGVLLAGLTLLGLNRAEPQRRFAPSDPVISKTGTLGFYSVGRGEALILRDDRGNVIISCHSLNCGYKNDRSDEGKPAEFLLRGEAVVGIRIEGVSRIGEDQITRRYESKDVQFGIMAFVGLAILIGSLIL